MTALQKQKLMELARTTDQYLHEVKATKSSLFAMSVAKYYPAIKTLASS